MTTEYMKKFLVVSLASLTITGCATRQEILNGYRVTCMEYGYTYGTQEFARCVQTQEIEEQKRWNRHLENQRKYDLERQKIEVLKKKSTPHVAAVSQAIVVNQQNATNNDWYIQRQRYNEQQRKLEADLRKIQEEAKRRQEKADALLARQIQQQELEKARLKAEANKARAKQIADDEALARKLQAEEYARGA